MNREVIRLLTTWCTCWFLYPFFI